MTPDIARPYAIRLAEQRMPDRSIAWFAEHPELPGCHAVARTEGEALGELARSTEAWLTVARELGKRIPEPESDTQKVSIIRLLRRHWPKPEIVSESESEVFEVEIGEEEFV